MSQPHQDQASFWSPGGPKPAKAAQLQGHQAGGVCLLSLPSRGAPTLPAALQRHEKRRAGELRAHKNRSPSSPPAWPWVAAAVLPTFPEALSGCVGSARAGQTRCPDGPTSLQESFPISLGTAHLCYILLRPWTRIWGLVRCRAEQQRAELARAWEHMKEEPGVSQGPPWGHRTQHHRRQPRTDLGLSGARHSPTRPPACCRPAPRQSMGQGPSPCLPGLPASWVGSRLPSPPHTGRK